ncbi:MAG: ATP-binding protein [Bacteroidales bacterium]
MIIRHSEKELKTLSKQFNAVAVTGPRQSGKTTLVKKVFPDKPYVNLENPDTRRFAIEDPRGFLNNYPEGAILDEVQRVPDIFSYLQQILDDSKEKGLFILTGSNNFLLQENISQSLAGRVAYLFLLPLSYAEIGDYSNINGLLLKGCYPAIYSSDTNHIKFYQNYVRTYVERDVRLIRNISDLYTFEKFLHLLAGRTGQLLNMSSLSNDVGVDVKTIGSWISVLETSFIVFRLRPYHENFNKRVVKMPKLYFFDTGLACSLLGIETETQLATHPLRGSLFENAVVLDFLKRRYNAGKENNLFFWRDNTGNEIDLLLVNSDKKTPVEIKSSQTISGDFFKGIQFWNKISDSEGGYIVYGGDTMQKRSNGISAVPFHEMDKIVD